MNEKCNFNQNNTRRSRNEGIDGLNKNFANMCGSPSDVTIYRNAVEIIEPPQDVSSSSDDGINTSDESLEKISPPQNVSRCNDPFQLQNLSFVANERREEWEHHTPRSRSLRSTDRTYHRDERTPSRPRGEARIDDQQQEIPPEVHAENQIREAERGKAQMNRQALLHSVLVDENYLVVAAHVDDLTKQKILQFEYVDFSKLLPHDRVLQEEDQRLTIINKGGVSYLVPVGETLSGIHGYGKWDQAFRVYSDIITSRFPSKAQELIQYNHIIHTASQTYVWDNVYMYDKDFRIHISRNPTRSWAIILQQAWAMRLKDRLSGSQVRNYPEGGRSKDYCRRFQRGKCHLGASCKFEHRC